MDKFKEKSLNAHFIMFVFFFFLGGVFWINGDKHDFGTLFYCLLKSSVLVFGLATLVFLWFAIPLERGGLKKSSLRYRWLKAFLPAEIEINKKINICYLPGLLLEAFNFSLFYLVFWFIGLILGNMLYPILYGKYIRLDEELFPESRDIPKLPKMKGLVLRPWMIWVLLLTFWGIWKIIYFCYSNFNAHISTPISLLAKIFVGLLAIAIICLLSAISISLIKDQILTPLKNILKAIDEKICITGQIIDE